MRIKIFDDSLSLLHFFLGFLCSFLYLNSSPWINIALLITIIYYAYEFIEALLDLDFSSLIGDLLEFFLGLVFGWVIVFLSSYNCS